MAETFFVLQTNPDPRILEIRLGKPSWYYPVDKRFTGKDNHHQWATAYSTAVICPLKRNALRSRPKSLRSWVAFSFGRFLRQLTINWPIPFDLLKNALTIFLAFGLELQRCITFASGSNRNLARPNLDFAEPIRRAISSA